MAVTLRLEPIKIPRLNVEAVQKQIDYELRLVGRELTDRLDTTTATWHGDKPKFIASIATTGRDVRLTVRVGGPAMGVKKWNWLDQGTRVRHAVMSRDWVSKTSPATNYSKLGGFKSGPGRGKMVFVSRKIRRPGIKARNWSWVLFKAYAPEFADHINNAIRAWATHNAWQAW